MLVRRFIIAAAAAVAAAAVAASLLAPAVARAEGGCQRGVEVRLAPVARAQLAVWVEDATGAVVDTLFVTRSTGLLGIGNRPGNPRLRSDYRFPYGARTMVLPVWAHRRGRVYPRVVMGGATGFDSDDTIGNHFAVSSPETFYCGPQGGVHRDVAGVDVVSCASPFFGSKGRYAADGSTSPYPPRADLVAFTLHDADDVRLFASENDLAAVSGATPPGGKPLAPPLRFMPAAALADGSYRVRVEASLEGDAAPAWPTCSAADPGCAHPTFLDTNPELRGYGKDVLGQPSVVWSVPFTLDATPRVATTSAYEGYGDWDGATGTLHPPDGTISEQVAGSGAERLLRVSDGDGAWRVKVTTLGCAAACVAPDPVGALALAATDTALTVRFAAPGGPSRPARYEVRYAAGALGEATFSTGIPGDRAPLPGPPGAAESVELTGLKADVTYTVGVRAVAACGRPSPARFATASTGSARFAVLHGCFVATAAYGSPLAAEVDVLRRFRDRRLLPTPLGRAATAAYYAFGPSLATAVAADPRLRAAARAALAPLVALAR